MKPYFASIKQYCWVVLACFILSIAGGFYLTKAQPTAFTVTSVFAVNQYYTGGAAAPSTSPSDLLTAATNYSGEISTREVMLYVIQKYPEITRRGFTADDLIADVVASPSTTVPTVALTATTSKPGDAVLLANSVADGFASYIQAQLQSGLDQTRTDLQTKYNSFKTDSDNLAKQILSYPSTDPHIALLSAQRSNDLTEMSDLSRQIADLPTVAPSNIQVVQHVVLADASVTSKSSTVLIATGGIGLILGLLVMLLLIFLDKRLRSEVQIGEKLGLAYIGGMSTNNEFKSTPTRLSGVAARQVADVGANLRLSGILRGKWQAPAGVTLLITSPQAAEGKTTLAVALASTLAQGGLTIVVVDGNLNQPSTHLAFGMKPVGPGLHGVLMATGRDAAVDDAVIRTSIPGVWLLPVGTRLEASALLLEQKMPAIVDNLRKKTDVVIIDGPAVLGGADASVLASMADGVALVIDARHEKLPVLKRAREVLSTLTTVPIGVVVNRKMSGRKNQYYATAVPTRAGSDQWQSIPGHQSTAKGNGHSHEMDNGQKEELLSPPAAISTTIAQPVRPSNFSPVVGVPPTPSYPTYQFQSQEVIKTATPLPPLSPRPGSMPRRDLTPPPSSPRKGE